MLVYHAAWDLHAFGLSATDPGAAPGWRILGFGVAGAFLALSGVSLGVARLRGATMAEIVQRIGRIGLCALLVTGVTAALSPAAPVWFGILHCIAVTNLCAVLVIRLRVPVLLGAAGLALLAPMVIQLPSGLGWAWIGLTAEVPASLDFRPVLPWLGIVLAGLAVGRSTGASRLGSGAARLLERPGRLFGVLRWSGRRSLVLYLAHQPVLVGALMLSLGTGWPSAPAGSLRDPVEATAFLQRCGQDCARAGGDAILCRSTCHCVLTQALSAGRPNRSTFGLGEIGAAVAACRPGNPGADVRQER